MTREPSTALGHPDVRPGMAELQVALTLLSSSQRRLAWRSKKGADAMTQERLRALVYLAEGDATHGEIGRHSGLNAPSVTALVDDLEERGLVTRRKDDADGRVWWVALTATGRTEVVRLYSEWIDVLQSALNDVSDDDIEAACRVLKRVVTGLDALGPVD